MKKTIMIFTAAAAVLFAACSGQEKKDGHEENGEAHGSDIELTDAQLKTVGIALGGVEKRNLGNVVRANGSLRLNPQDRGAASSLMAGVVKTVNVVEGQRVGRGAVVAYISNMEIVDMQKNYLSAVREAAFAKQEYRRQKSLASQGAGVEKTRQQASAGYAVAEANRTGLARQLEQIGISPESVARGNITTRVAVKSPISGIVSKVNVSVGSYVDMQTPIVEVTDNSAVYCSLDIFARDADKVRPGQKVDMVLTSDPTVRLAGTVGGINRTIDPVSKTMSARVSINAGPVRSLVSGSYVTALISRGSEEVSAVPDDAIVMAEGRKYIFVLDGKKRENGTVVYHFRRSEVAVGVSELGYTQITPVDKLPAGAEIVRSNAFYLASMTAEHGEH